MSKKWQMHNKLYSQDQGCQQTCPQLDSISHLHQKYDDYRLSHNQNSERNICEWKY